MKTATVSYWAVPVAVGAGIALLGVLWLLLAVHVPSIPASHSLVQAPSVTLAPTQQSDHLFDLEPLFLPTKYNTSTLTVPYQASKDPNSIAANFPPKWSFSEAAGGMIFPEPVVVPARLVDVLSYGEPPNPWPEVGRADIGVPNLEPRSAFIEVAVAKTGKPILSSVIPVGAGLTLPTTDWTPLEFLVAVDSAGLMGVPVITGSTTTDEVESVFRTFLAKTFHLGARLRPGFYTVRIGP